MSNNEHPTGPPSPRFTPVPEALRSLREGASEEQWRFFMHEAVTLYANIAHGHNQNWPAIIEAIREIRTELHASRAERHDLHDRIEAAHRAVARAESDLRHVHGRLESLELAEISRRAPMREEAKSHHDWSEELARLDQELTRRVKDKRDPMTSDRARELAKEVVRETEDGKILSRWRVGKGWIQRMATEVVKDIFLLSLGWLAAHYLAK